MSRSARFVQLLTLSSAALVAALTIPATALAQGSPTYDSDQTRVLVESMIDAHGGLDRWWAAPSFDYTVAMYLAAMPVGEDAGRRHADNWRFYRVAIEPRSSRGYVSLPGEGTGDVHVGHDGKQVWRRPYSFDVQRFRDNPMQLLYYHYSMLSLPWLTQQEGVNIARADDAELQGKAGLFAAVDLTFAPEGKTHGGYYRLFIDKESARLSGWVATTPYPLLPGAVLPEELGGNGRPNMFRVVDDWMDADGLLIPQAYNTFMITADGAHLAGTHLVVEPSFSSELRTQLLARPADAEIVLPRR